MVEESNSLQDSEPAAEEEISDVRKLVGFVLTLFLTLLLIPFLFLGACMGIFDFGARGWLTFGFAAVVLLALLAIKTKNPGVRWGIIVLALMAAVLAMFLFVRW